MDETKAEKIARLQREIGERQAELAVLICGDQVTRVTLPCPHCTPCTCGTSATCPVHGVNVVVRSRGPYEGSDGWPQ